MTRSSPVARSPPSRAAGEGIASWSGTAWSLLAGGVASDVTGGPVLALRGFEDAAGPALFLGGSFSRVDGQAAYALAKWFRPLTCTDSTPPTISIGAPSPGVVNAKPLLAASYSDSYSEIDPASLQGRSTVPHSLRVPPRLPAPAAFRTWRCQTGRTNCAPASPTWLATVARRGGRITVDSPPPTLSFTTPPDGAVLTTGDRPMTFPDGQRGRHRLDGSTLPDRTSASNTGCTTNSREALHSQFRMQTAHGRCASRSPTRREPRRSERRVTSNPPPALEILAPAEGAVTSDTTPEIRLRMSDAGTVSTSPAGPHRRRRPLAVSCQTFSDMTTAFPSLPSRRERWPHRHGSRPLRPPSPLLSRSFTVRLDFPRP